MTVRIACEQSILEPLLEHLVANDIEHSRPMAIEGGTAPLNAPVDPEMLKELVFVVTVSIGSLNSFLAALDKTIDKSISIKKKIKILFPNDENGVVVESKSDLEKVKKKIEDNMEQK